MVKVDSIISISSGEEIEEFVKPYALMVPYLIKAFASPAEQDELNDAGYKIRRCGEIPQNKKSGDCGVYALTYIECLALDVDMKIGPCDANIKDIQQKLATGMFMEANHWEDL
ncbi:unnamed protein product [Arabidopsis lyrata]|nr:unnamed protein product [Arabidopsis lyrata]